MTDCCSPLRIGCSGNLPPPIANLIALSSVDLPAPFLPATSMTEPFGTTCTAEIFRKYVTSTSRTRICASLLQCFVELAALRVDGERYGLAARGVIGLDARHCVAERVGAALECSLERGDRRRFGAIE